MNILFSSQKDQPSSGISITKVEKKQAANKTEKCLQCDKKLRELNELIYMKSQIESRYNESVLNLNIQLKANEDNKKDYSSLNDNHNKLKEEYNAKRHEVIQLENIIMSLKEKIRNISQQQQTISNKAFESNNEISTNDALFNLRIKSQYEMYGKQICELESDNASLLIDNSNLKKQIEMLKLVNVKLTSQSSELIEENRELLLTQRELRIDNESLLIKSSSIEQRYLEVKQQLNKQIAEAKELKQDLKAIQMNNGHVSSLAACLETENEKIKMEYASMQKESNIALRQCKENKQNDIESALTNVMNENKLLLEENSQLKGIIGEHQKKIQQLSSTSIDNKIDKGTVDQLNAMINQLRMQIEAQEDDIMQLNNQNAFLKKFYDQPQPNQLQKEDNGPMYKPKDRNDNLIEEFERRLVQYESENRELSLTVNELKKESINSQDTVLSLNKQVTNLQGRLCEADINFLSLEEENCELNKEIVAMKISSTELTEMNIKLQKEKEEVLAEMRSSKETCGSIIRAKQAMSEINNSKEQMILNLNNELLIKDKLIDENKDIIFEQSKIIEEYKDRVTTLENDKGKLLNVIHKKKLYYHDKE